MIYYLVSQEYFSDSNLVRAMMLEDRHTNAILNASKECWARPDETIGCGHE